MKPSSNRNAAETITGAALLHEIDERHFISEQVFSRREQRGWSQDQLAAEAGMTQAQVALVESGQANPTLRSLVKLAHAFGCTISELSSPHGDDAASTASGPAAEVLPA